MIGRDAALGERLQFLQNALGAVPGAMDAFLVLRGIKTLALRMQRHAANALALAEWLATRREVAGNDMQVVLAEYAKIHDALARDTLDGVGPAATRIALKAASMSAPEGFPTLPKQVADSAKEVAAAGALAPARTAFKNLSAPLVAWALATKPQGVVALHCSMANASWLQTGSQIRNPYYGSSMLACGEVAKPSATSDGQSTTGAQPMTHGAHEGAHSGHAGHAGHAGHSGH